MRKPHINLAALSVMATVSVAGCQAGTSNQTPPPRQREIDRLAEQTLIEPPIKAEAGFTAELLVPPGDLYDPHNIRPQPDGIVWIDDDGGQEGSENGGRLWAIDQQGHVSTLVETRYLLPILGFDIAAPEMGPLAGTIFMLTQARPTLLGAASAHVIEYLDPNTPSERHRVCALPKNGTLVLSASWLDAEARQALAGVAGAGVAGRFGPTGSLFAKRFFAVTVMNATVYEVTADGVCRPFISFADGGAPLGMSFSPDGSMMLLSVANWRGRDSALLSVAPDGTPDPQPVLVLPGEGIRGAAIAPASFGPYAGHVFVTTRAASPPEGEPGEVGATRKGLSLRA